MKLLIVIINYRTCDLTIDCLRSLAAEVPALGGTRVVVTDNASGDGSIECIAAAIQSQGWSEWATVSPLERNGGFSYGNNGAIRPALQSPDPPRYVLLLNPDTYIRPGAVRALLDFMDAHPMVGLTGSRLEDPDGTPQRSAFRFPSIVSELEAGLRLGAISRLLRRWIVAPPISDAACRTDWAAAASLMIRREVFEAIGLMDEEYFMYFEETDFCRHARRAGWECWYLPQSRVVHLVGQSSGVTDPKQRRRRPGYWFESRRRYFLKNHGLVYTAIVDAVWTAGFALWRARRAVMRRPDPDPPYFLRDFIRHSVWTGKVSVNKSANIAVAKTSFEQMTFRQLIARVKEDWIAHGRDWTRPGFRAVAAHRFGNWRMNLRPKIVRIPFSLIYRAMYRRCRNVYGIELDYTAQIGRRVVFEHQGAVVIHGNASIGDECIIRHGVTLGIRDMERPFDAPQLGNRVDIGAGAKLLGCITIGDGARIGANAVVLRDVPAGATAVGIPARIIPANGSQPEAAHVEQ